MLRTKVFRGEEIKVLDEATGRVSALVSSEKMDRDGDVIRAEGWDLSNFRKHPVLLSSHDYHSLRSQIGVWESMEVEGSQMKGVARFFIGKGNPEADWAFELAKQKALAFSVGFIPNMEKAAPLNEKDVLGTGGMEFKGQELLEVSAVTVPSNPDAIQRFIKTPNLHPVVREIAEEVMTSEETEIDEDAKDTPSVSETIIDIIYERVMARVGEMIAPAEQMEAEVETPVEESETEDEVTDEGDEVVSEFDAYSVALNAAEEILSELEGYDE